MRYIECPEIYENNDGTSVFLAGGITNCPDWQQEIVTLLEASNFVILNPRRKHFPKDDNNAALNQIKWEFEHFRKSDIILFWFPKETINPIVLYELGAWSMTSKKLVVGVHPEYVRRVDVEIQTKLARPDVTIVYSLKELKDNLSLI